MGRFLVVSTVEQLERYREIALKYHVGFEYNDFYAPRVLSDREKQQERIQAYALCGVTQEENTMHGAFYDVTVFSEDEEIAKVSQLRMRQSMEIAAAVKAKGVVFHTNINPFLESGEYLNRAVSQTVETVSRLLEEFPERNLYMENMFDATPEMLRRISEQLCSYPNYGVCLDYAHAGIAISPLDEWVFQLAPYIRHLHINDHDGKQDLHLAVGDGVTDWQQFKRYYETYLGDCSVLIETTNPEWQIKSIAYLTELGVIEI